MNYRGGFYSRAGTAYVARSKQTPPSVPPRIITFQYNITQGYVLEFGNLYIRFFTNGAPIVEVSQAITNITNANPGVFTVIAHGYSSGDWVIVANCTGLTALNGQTFIVNVLSANTFSLFYLGSSQVDTTALGGYTGAGIVERIYTLASPYADTDLALLKFAQSADAMSITHQSYPPYDLKRITSNNWTLTAVSFGAGISPPASCSVVATVQPSTATDPATLPAAYAFQITAVSATGEESVPSPPGNVTNSVDISATAGSLIVTWPAAANAKTYNVYKAPTSYNTLPGSSTDALPVPAGALFGYTGTSYGLQFVDSNVVPTFAETPPQHTNPFAPGQVLQANITNPGSYTVAPTPTISSGTGSGFTGQVVLVGTEAQAVIITNPGSLYGTADTLGFTSGVGSGAAGTLEIGPETGTYPGVVTYFQQRRVYASTANDPDTFYMSQPGLFLNFDVSEPPVDTNAITGTPWAQQVNGIQWLLPMPGGMVTFTGLGAWQVTGAGGSATNPVAITPTSEQAQPQAFNGCSATVPPIPINYDILYVPSINTYVRDLAYNYWINIYTGTDITELNSHLFTQYQIVQWAWCQEPQKILWVVRSDGALLSLTYLKEQEVIGWCRHDTFGLFESTCSVIEPPVYAAYFVVTRFPSTGTAYYIERMDNRQWQTVEDPWCVDCALAYPMPEPAAALQITGSNTIGGTATLTASGSVFTSALVSAGAVVRSGGGIVQLSSFTSGTVVTGSVIYPVAQIYTDGGLNASPVFQAQGAWTMTVPTSTLTGLRHLSGLTVTGLADGIPIPPTTVSASGTITLAAPASDIKVGLGYTVQGQSLYSSQPQQPTVQGRRKSITAVTVRVDSSLPMQVGANQPDGSTLTPPQLAPTWSNLSTASPLTPLTTYTAPGGGTVTLPFTGDLRVPVGGDWQKPGQVAVQQSLPVPMQITAFVPEILPGDLPEGGYDQKDDKPPGKPPPSPFTNPLAGLPPGFRGLVR